MSNRRHWLQVSLSQVTTYFPIPTTFSCLAWPWWLHGSDGLWEHQDQAEVCPARHGKERGLAECFVAVCSWEVRLEGISISLGVSTYHFLSTLPTLHTSHIPIFHSPLPETYLQKELSSQVLKLLLSTARVIPRQTPKHASTKLNQDLWKKQTRREELTLWSGRASPSYHNPKDSSWKPTTLNRENQSRQRMKAVLSPGMVVHVFNTSTQRAEDCRSMSLRSVWST